MDRNRSLATPGKPVAKGDHAMNLRILVTAGTGLALALGTVAAPALAAKAGHAIHKAEKPAHKAAATKK
jgi:hypothetical protein